MKYYSAKDLRTIKKVKEIKLIKIKNVKTKKEKDYSKEKESFRKFNKINESFYNKINKKTEISEKNILFIQKELSQIRKEINKDYNRNKKYNKKDNVIKIKNIKKIHHIENNIKNFKLLNQLTKDSYSDYTLDNTFVVFTSIDDIINLIYANKNRSIISYNIRENKKVNEIKKAHNRDITNFRHFLDKKNKRDLIISLSLSDNNLKLWNINNYECLINLENINKTGKLFSSCLLNDNNHIFIITSCAYGNNESIKLFDMNSNKFKEINDSNDNTFYIDIYNDIKLSKKYIITGNNGYLKSYDYNENKVYHIYNDKDNSRHCSATINNKEEIIKMIESSFDGHIRIWDFHSGILLNKIKVCDNDWLFGICLWDNEHLFVGCGDKTIKIINLKKKLIISKLNDFNKKVLCLKKLKHLNLGEFLISQGYENEQIKIFVNKNILI